MVSWMISVLSRSEKLVRVKAYEQGLGGADGSRRTEAQRGFPERQRTRTPPPYNRPVTSRAGDANAAMPFRPRRIAANVSHPGWLECDE